MQHTWETCTFDTTQARWSGIHVTMNPKGLIYLNGKAMSTLRHAERVELLYDRFNNTIGVKPSNTLNKFAFKAAVKGKHGGRKIRAYRLLQQFDIKLDRTVRFLKPEVNDEGFLILDLRNTTTSALRRRPL